MWLNPFDRKVRERDGFPVAPGAFPVVGHLPAIVYGGYDFFVQAEKQLGRTFWFQNGPGRWQLLTTGTDGFGLLKNKVTSSSHLDSQDGREFLGSSVINNDGPEHQRMRGAMNSPFTPKGLSAEAIGPVLADLIEARTRTYPGQQLSILTETRTVALELIFRLIGIRPDDLEEWSKHYSDFLLFAFGMGIDLPGTPLRRSRAAKKWLDERLGKLVEDVRNNPESTGMLAELVRGRDEQGRGLTHQELLDNLRILVLAGHETTASIMAWSVLELARAPELWKRLVAEARAYGRLPRTPKELKEVPLAEALFRESLRIYPPLQVNPRQVSGPLELDGKPVPLGTEVATSLVHIARDPNLFPDPLRFNPDRWLAKKEPPSALEMSPFGGGPHFCLGYHLALMEGVLFLVGIALALGEQDMRPHLVNGFPKPRYLPLAQPGAKTLVRFAP